MPGSYEHCVNCGIKLQEGLRRALEKFRGYRLIHEIDYTNAIAIQTTIVHAHELARAMKLNFNDENKFYPDGPQRQAVRESNFQIWVDFKRLLSEWQILLPNAAIRRCLEKHKDAGPACSHTDMVKDLGQHFISTAYSDRSQLRTVFAKHLIDTEECESICSYFRIESCEEMLFFPVYTTGAYACMYDPGGLTKLEKRLFACVADFQASGCDIDLFLDKHRQYYEIHPECLPCE